MNASLENPYKLTNICAEQNAKCTDSAFSITATTTTTAATSIVSLPAIPTFCSSLCIAINQNNNTVKVLSSPSNTRKSCSLHGPHNCINIHTAFEWQRSTLLSISFFWQSSIYITNHNFRFLWIIQIFMIFFFIGFAWHFYYRHYFQWWSKKKLVLWTFCRWFLF